MSEEIKPATPAVPPAVAPPAVQAPATPAVPVETPKPVETPAPTPAPAAQPAPPAEQLLKPEIPKPTLEALKLPKDHLVPKDELAEILSSSKTIEEAQSTFDRIQGAYTRGMQRLEAQSQTWISQLKGDAELGGQKWEETKNLYQSGLKRMFGEEAINDLLKNKMDSLPWLVRGVVRAERAAGVKPIVNPPATPPKPAPKTMSEVVYGDPRYYNEKDPAHPLTTPRW